MGGDVGDFFKALVGEKKHPRKDVGGGAENGGTDHSDCDQPLNGATLRNTTTALGRSILPWAASNRKRQTGSSQQKYPPRTLGMEPWSYVPCDGVNQVNCRHPRMMQCAQTKILKFELTKLQEYRGGGTGYCVIHMHSQPGLTSPAVAPGKKIIHAKP